MKRHARRRLSFWKLEVASEVIKCADVKYVARDQTWTFRSRLFMPRSSKQVDIEIPDVHGLCRYLLQCLL